MCRENDYLKDKPVQDPIATDQYMRSDAKERYDEDKKACDPSSEQTKASPNELEYWKLQRHLEKQLMRLARQATLITETLRILTPESANALKLMDSLSTLRREGLL